jgi:hypothetical protein
VRHSPAVPDYVRLLEAGINVVTTTSTRPVYPATFSPEWREQLAAAAQSGRSSRYASGIFPGFGSDQLALALATQSKTIRTVDRGPRAGCRRRRADGDPARRRHHHRRRLRRRRATGMVTAVLVVSLEALTEKSDSLIQIAHRNYS